MVCVAWKKRAGPNKAKAEADDIITILQLADDQKLLNRLPSYVAANIDRLPTTPVESMDVVILAKKLRLLDQRLNPVPGANMRHHAKFHQDRSNGRK